MQKLKLTKRYEKYPEYKDSGVEWLGKIPEGWKINKLKRLFDFQSGDGFPDNLQGGQNGDIPFMKVSDINGIDRYITTSNNYVDFKTVKKESWHLIPIGSILMPKIGAALGKNHRKVNLVPVCIDNNMLAVTPKNIVSEYGFWIWKMLNMSDFENISSVPSVNIELLRNYICLIPSDKDQEKMSFYLDKKTDLIDKIIEKKQKQIDKLKEKRNSVINTLIINADGKIGKLKNYIYLNPSKKIVSVNSPEDTVSFVPMEAISELGELQLQERKYKDVSSGFTYFRNGDVVLAKITPCYENGKAGVMKSLKNGFGFGTTEFMVMRPNSSILADFLYYVIFSDKFRKMGEVEMRGTAGQKRVTSSFVMNYELSIPDIKTQERIIMELNKKMKIFGVSIAKAEKSISYLKEFKESLIFNVVTGKIKIN